MPRRSKSAIVSVAGLNSQQVNKARQKASELISGNKFITLPISDTEVAEFELFKIPASEIETRTIVPANNGRKQHLLTEESLSDIIPTIASRGQQTPGLGFIDDDGKVVVLCSSRRRKACIFTNSDYLIYATKVKLTIEQSSEMAKIGNAYKPLSLVEQGEQFEELLTDGTFSTAAELAKAMKVDPARVSLARTAHSLPSQIIDFFPSVNDIGKPTIKILKKIVDESSDIQLKEILNKISEYSLDDIKTLAVGDSLTELNKTALDLIVSSVNKPNRNTKSVSEKVPGGGTVSVSKSTKGISFSFKGLKPEQIVQIEASVREVINRQ